MKQQTAFDKIKNYGYLHEVWKDIYRRAKNKTSSGVDRITARQFQDNLSDNLHKTIKELKGGYSFLPLKAVGIEKPSTKKLRIICIPTMRDRLVQRALLQFMEPYSTSMGIINQISFGFFRDPSGRKRGIEEARDAAKKIRQQYPWAVKTDIKSFFDCIPRDKMFRQITKSFRCRSLHGIIQAVIDCEIDISQPRMRRICRDNGIVRGRGLRQGMPLSPFFSNILLKDFDRNLAKRGIRAVRYADDIIAFASSREECENTKTVLENHLNELDLDLNREKTKYYAPNEGVEFLGLELCFDTSGQIRLLVTNDQLSKIKQRFAEFHDVDRLLGENYTAFKLHDILGSMRAGYRTAYGIADNRKDVYSSIDRCLSKCMDVVFSRIIGADVVQRLTSSERCFMGLTQKDSTPSV
jgi:group II intron reverse transcriptase/maturase